MQKRILTATGNTNIDNAIKAINNFQVVGKTLYKDELENKCSALKPDILLVANTINGHEPLIPILLRIKTKNPAIRIVYLTGEINLRDSHEMSSLNLLIMAGVYDIVHEKTMTLEMLRQALITPKAEDDVKNISIAADKNTYRSGSASNFEFIVPEDYKEKDEDVKDKLFVISSIKPGTGKSFISVNIAAAIAKYGEDNEKGERPKVGLIEADLQNLSLGTLLQIEEDNKNVKTAMSKIGEIITEDGELFGNQKEIEEVNSYVKKCFIPYYKISNLKALVGSQLAFEEMEEIYSYHYMYLIDSVIDDFDILIVDTNSALTHVTTYPLLHMANSCYYILNLDFNNVRNNTRYKKTLERMKISDKVKYILNEDIPANQSSNSEELLFTANHLEDSGFKLEARIPVIPKTVFLNRLYQGTPIVLDEGIKNNYIRNEIFKVANQIYPIKGFSETKNEENKKNRGRLFK